MAGGRCRRSALFLLGLLLTAACNARPARDALDEAEQAIAAARPDLEAYAPRELAALRAELARGRAQLAAGHYTEALRLAQRLPGPIQEAVEMAARRKAEVGAEWSKLAGVLVPELRGLGLRLDQLSSPSSARGLDEAGLAGLRAELSELSAGWARAQASFASAQASQALAAGRELRARTEALAARLGLSPAAAVALGEAPAGAAPTAPGPVGAATPAPARPSPPPP